MFTGDPALDAWLAQHGAFLIVAVAFTSLAVMFLIGLVVDTRSQEPARTTPASSNRKAARKVVRR